ncbi:periplasmic binding protein-like I [Catenaria anguillulae PL171]|uniref:Periplasmic binding protein-like I n=1 Tax=Catenaria anguillulae PL171 TaxID=765915 RepID=A0A1Y2I456_9FUNG|nr:periplasmic binding protein-like I [Catenaria anguillulae PL171]
MALAAQNLGLYMCSGAATATALSDKSSFPTMFRTIPSDGLQGIALAKFVKAMGWSSCSVVASSSAYGRSIADAFLLTADQLQVNVATMQVINFDQAVQEAEKGSTTSLKLPAQTVAEAGARIVMFFGEPTEFTAFAPVAKSSGIIGSDWVWIGSEAISGVITPDMTQEAKDLARGMMHIFPTEFQNAAEANSLLTRYKRIKPAATRLEPYSGFHVDCLYGLTHMFIEILKSGSSTDAVLGRNPAARVPLSRGLKPFDGLSGRVTFDGNGDRKGSYRMLNVWDNQATPVYEIDVEGEVKEIKAPKYFSGSTERPADRPDSLIMFLRFSRFGAWIVCFIVAAVILAVIVSTAMVLRQWNSRIVNEYGQGVLIFIAIGLSLVLGSTVSWIDIQTRLSCNISLWGIALGFEMIVVPLLYRTYYTWTTFENTILRRNTVRSTFLRTLPFVGIFLIQPVILGLWTLFAPSNRDPFQQCRPSRSFASQPTLFAQCLQVDHDCLEHAPAVRPSVLDELNTLPVGSRPCTSLRTLCRHQPCIFVRHPLSTGRFLLSGILARLLLGAHGRRNLRLYLHLGYDPGAHHSAAAQT